MTFYFIIIIIMTFYSNINFIDYDWLNGGRLTPMDVAEETTRWEMRWIYIIAADIWLNSQLDGPHVHCAQVPWDFFRTSWETVKPNTLYDLISLNSK